MDITQFRTTYTRPATGDIRFSAPMMMQVLGQSAKGTGPMLVDIGAKYLGQARVNKAEGGETQKDCAYSVLLDDWDGFVARLGIAVGQGVFVSPARPQRAQSLSMGQRLANIEAMLAQLLAR